ncbi:methyltransferase domain-containing protein [uncultured Parasphingopyxis sp.]|uniref:methyltransferase domain-containing protein n=1 Tax=uncultured Parasphingopyxis sp. TaxID=1547918 RepID=UPI00262FFD47|nr:methyltransferase domain-containing protein [uncultured Parasphingopyxis sp.]
MARLFQSLGTGTSPAMEQTGPFDRALRRVRRDRAASRWDEASFLQQRMADELLDRLDSVKREFSQALILGYVGDDFAERLAERGIETTTVDPGRLFAERSGGLQGDEDEQLFDDGSFDLILSCGMLDTVNDLPGALILANRSLKPDGLFLAAFLGVGSLPVLRKAMMTADLASGGGQPRIHPQIDVRSAGDLLSRAGFALPVADGDRVEVKYRSFDALLFDLRGGAMSSLLGGRPLSKTGYSLAKETFENAAEDGRTTEIFEIVYLTAWSPSPDQPKPARRGSGGASLADVLGKQPK